MRFYLAPMEGITGWVFRQAVRDHFGEGIDAYFSPFIVPHEKRALASRDIQNICPEHNEGMHLIPQVLTNSAAGFLDLEKAIADLGYDEINLNLGCPSKTVTNKGRGSGFLKEPEQLDRFLDEIFSKSSTAISLKTRIGYDHIEEWEELLEIYKKYPIKELTIHPRTGTQMYEGEIHMDEFCRALEESNLPICYNGEIRSKADVDRLLEKLDGKRQPESVMIGRGILADPSIFREISGGAPASRKEILEFLNQVEAGYVSIMDNEKQTLFKMKEIWTFMKVHFPEEEKAIKKIIKSKSLREYEVNARAMLENC